jgi:Fe-S-cluster-containing hydrogenase component 2
VCPTKAAHGERKKAHVIDQDTCIQCGLCFEACRFDAIEIASGREEIAVAGRAAPTSTMRGIVAGKMPQGTVAGKTDGR